MIIPLWALWICMFICVGALTMTLVNLRYFRRSRADAQVVGDQPSVGVCIPARNEQANIEACVRSILAQDYSNVRVFVYDDQSDDDTPKILARLMSEDKRVRSVATKPLESGWVGKQWACWQLGQAADTDIVLFIDADVRLSPDCVRRSLATMAELNVEFLSTFPRQLTHTLGERLLIPLIHFILLSYLPFARMRNSNDPAASAACGQFIMARRDAYLKVGGHSACRNSMHDGVKLPRIFRAAGLRTDLFDGTDVCECRMYRGFANTWRGFAKNAFEGLGSVGLLVFITVLHLAGHVLPFVAAIMLAVRGELLSFPEFIALLAIGVMYVQRLVLAARFKQSLVSVVLHPVGVLLMTLVQWHSLILAKTGRRGWRGRTLVETTSREITPGAAA